MRDLREEPPQAGAEPEYRTISLRSQRSGRLWSFRVREGEVEARHEDADYWAHPWGNVGTLFSDEDAGRLRAFIEAQSQPMIVGKMNALAKATLDGETLLPYDEPERKPRIYIAGPMTGLPESNYPAFNAAAAAWRAVGWDVVNPAEAFDGAEDLPYHAYVAHDVRQLQTVQAIALLPGWNNPKARGSVWECEIARDILHLDEYDATDPVPPGTEPRRMEPAPETSFVVTGADHAHSTITLEPIVTGITAYEPPRPPLVIPTDSQARKDTPLTSGVIDYFPAALAYVARVSKSGNDKHNPGQPLHHARGKSMDHADCIARHLADRGGFDPDDNLRHSGKMAWRSLALLQEELEATEGAALPRAARRADA